MRFSKKRTVNKPARIERSQVFSEDGQATVLYAVVANAAPLANSESINTHTLLLRDPDK